METITDENIYSLVREYVNNPRNFPPIGIWDVSRVTDMSGLFNGCKNFNEPLDNWDTSRVNNMSEMFVHCQDFNQPLNTNGIFWNTSQVNNMSGMFGGCKKFDQPLDSWDTSQVNNMSGMFGLCKKFNQPLDSWNTSRVTTMSAMFAHCKTFNQSLNSWDINQVDDMSYMFNGCINFNQPLHSWNIRQEKTDISKMFYECGKFKFKNLPNFLMQTKFNISDCLEPHNDLITLEEYTQQEIDSGKIVKLSDGRCYDKNQMKEWANMNPIFPLTRKSLLNNDLEILGILGYKKILDTIRGGKTKKSQNKYKKVNKKTKKSIKKRKSQ